jgi:diamine N-acetyltransferase
MMHEDDLLTSSRLKLRRTKPTDLEFVIETEYDPENKPFISQWTYEQHLSAISDRDCLHLVAEERRGQLMGYAIIFGVENVHSNIELMRIAISDQGKGYGKELLRLIQQYVFMKMQAHRLWLDVKEHNYRAQNLYEQLGFQIEGKLRECI